MIESDTELLRRAAGLMRTEHAHDYGGVFCDCQASDHWFDRSICPEPCGSMHYICVECGRIKGRCAVAVDARANRTRLDDTWLAVADWLETQGNLCHGHGSPAQRRALAVARAYLGEP